jgi:capsular exopolysaccharide synthesis family protein
MNQNNKLSIFDAYDSESPTAIELRRIYNNLRRCCTRENNTFLITSSNRGEGKSTIASHLALTIARIRKKKVLLIDADIRRPTLHEIFGLDRNNGLAESLLYNEDPIKLIKNTRQKDLYVITAGERSNSPSSLFETESISDILRKVKFYYDMVLIDSAPVLAVSDTLFLAGEANKIVFVILAGVTPREVVVRAMDIIKETNAEIVGAVVNNAMEVLPYYYEYKYYSKDSSLEI